MKTLSKKQINLIVIGIILLYPLQLLLLDLFSPGFSFSVLLESQVLHVKHYWSPTIVTKLLMPGDILLHNTSLVQILLLSVGYYSFNKLGKRKLLSLGLSISIIELIILISRFTFQENGGIDNDNLLFSTLFRILLFTKYAIALWLLHKLCTSLSAQKNTEDYAAEPTKIRRASGYLIDSYIILCVAFFLVKIVQANATLHQWVRSLFSTGNGDEWLYITYPIAFLLFYVISESISKTTIGKLITGTYVIQGSGEAANFKNALTRTIGRIIPLETFSIYMSGRAWHDSLSGTHVVMFNDEPTEPEV